MPTREQLNDERLRALIKELESKGTISPEMAQGLKEVRDFGEAEKVRKNTP